MSKTITVANQKGGVAKTTTAVNLATYLANFGKNILLIDLDPQANATSGTGVDRSSVTKNIYHVLVGQTPLEEILTPTSINRLTLAPSSLDLVGAEIELVNTPNRELRLREHINEIISKYRYDFVFVDTPPSLGLLTLNALAASDSVLIPMQCEYYALEGLAQLYKTIQLVKQNLNPFLSIEGLVFSMVDMRSNLTVQVIEEVKKFLQDKVYQTTIPRNIRLAEAPGFGKPIFSYDKTSKGAEAYERLAKEFLQRHNSVPSPEETLKEVTT